MYWTSSNTGEDRSKLARQLNVADIPSDVLSWYYATGLRTLRTHPKTVEVPPDVFAWYKATASAELPATYQTIVFIEAGATPASLQPGSTLAPGPTSSTSDPLVSWTSIPPSLFPTNSEPVSSNFPLPSGSLSMPSSLADVPLSSSNTASFSELPSPLESGPAATANAANTHSRNRAVPVAAGIIAALVFIAICACAFRYYKRRQRAKEQRESFGETGTFLKL
ncbi:hypothetical protein R3P38DRAFT_1053798 [Favolaschia claudopus]|uniref:Uncharacterized protein n=1 Tax=Favolaschia claudopus TaxID=2862362 RepID=A0AAW0BE60_9AGAR